MNRLLWQGGFKERHEWWEKELAHNELSSTVRHSKVYIDKFAEEGDSGVVVVDKSRFRRLRGTAPYPGCFGAAISTTISAGQQFRGMLRGRQLQLLNNPHISVRNVHL